MAIMTRCRMPPLSWCGYSSIALLGVGDIDELEHLDCPRLAPGLVEIVVW
jgi:hypothetical protein